jgi:hypothetical protein
MRAMRTTWLAVVLLLLGCDGKKSDECKVIGDTATADVGAIKTAAANKPTTSKDQAATARAIADAADKLAVEMGKKGPTTAELQKTSGDYQAIAKEISAAARDWADTFDKIAAMELKMKPEAADGDRKILDADQAKVKKRCAEKPAPECKALQPFLASAATMKADQLDKLEGDLGAITVKDTTLGQLVTSLRGSFAGLAKTLHDAIDTGVELKAVQAKAKTQGDAVDAAIAKEAPVTAALKAFCK